MKAAFVLAAKYLAYHRGRTALMVLAIALTAVLPLTAHWLIDAFSARLLARAIATPAVVGPRGDRYNLVLQSLYFAATDAGTVTQDDVRKLQATGMARAIPLHLRYSAGGTPLVGTSHAYFAQRGLRPAAGTLPLRLGQAVVGSAAAERLELAVGETLITDQRSLYDISATYPLKLHIVGILAATGTADDDAVFVDIKTTWVVDGLIHGHRDVSTAEAGAPDIAERSGGRVRANAAIVEYQEITAANAAEFHLHGDSARLPVSAILVIPHDAKAATLLQARYDHSETRQMLRPEARGPRDDGPGVSGEAFLRRQFRAGGAVCRDLPGADPAALAAIAGPRDRDVASYRMPAGHDRVDSSGRTDHRDRAQRGRDPGHRPARPGHGAALHAFAIASF
jgi:putative ABC transport system permease protein